MLALPASEQVEHLRAGWERDPERAGVLRQTFASHFLAVKPDLFALGRVLGHSHTRVTELYSHLLPDHLATTRNVVTFDAAK